MYDYEISDKVYEQYKSLCQKAYKRCGQQQELIDFKLIRMYDLGKKVQHSLHDTYSASLYQDLLITLHTPTNTLVDFIRTDEVSPYKVFSKQKDRYAIKYKEYHEISKQQEQQNERVSKKLKLNAIRLWDNLLSAVRPREYVAYCDWSYKDQFNKLGIGFSIRCESGEWSKVVAEYSEIIEDPNREYDSYIAEALALKKLLEKVDELNIKKIHVKGDDHSLIM